MAQTILSVAILILSGVICAVLWDNHRLRKLATLADAQSFLVQRTNEHLRENWEKEKEEAFERGRALMLDRRPEPKPINDKIPLGSDKYVPIARRRAAAEAASMGPQTHREQVIANDTKAMQSAG